ncbi:MAG TPA: ATP synthase F1 subunit delta [Acidimicrobiales bacterium]|nr:ATP synthase F1 subunit delta [Acidimicrobiales bacterium]
MRQSIRGYTDGIIERTDPSGLASLAAELGAVRDVIGDSDDLRRVLSDPGIGLAARRGVLTDLFGSRVGAATMRLISFVLDADRAPDTVDDIAWLASRLRAAADRMTPVADGVLGHKAAEERLDGYATAVLETVEGGHDLDEIEDELFRFQRVVAGSDQLRTVLTSRDVPADMRREVVSDLLSAKASPATTSMAAYATTVGRPRDYQDLLEALVTRVASESNRRLAEVRAAVEMDDTQQRHLADALKRAVGHDVQIRVTVDPSVVGGFVATIGDTVVDASARHQLELLKERLVMPEVRITTGQVTTEERQ